MRLTQPSGAVGGTQQYPCPMQHTASSRVRRVKGAVASTCNSPFLLSMKDNHLLCRWQQKALAKKSCGEGVPSPVGEGGPFARERWMRSNGLYRHLIRHPLRGCHLPPLGKAMMSYRICGGRASDASDRISCVFRCLPAIAPYRGRASLRLCRRS